MNTAPASGPGSVRLRESISAAKLRDKYEESFAGVRHTTSCNTGPIGKRVATRPSPSCLEVKTFGKITLRSGS
ncbi:hypothetical protein VNO77_19443 [Canavalia gladiata]|uniref:Uncharacterized protein n=1 Tax=Canavalia gladiata TaxID=3824 RepID=A0AAN9QLE3_CANGL